MSDSTEEATRPLLFFLHSEPLTCRSPSAPPIHFLTPCSHLPRVGPTGRQPHRDTRTVRRLPISETSRLWYTATTEPHVSSVLSSLIRTAILTLRLPIGIRTDRPAHTPLSSVLPILTVTACSLLERGDFDAGYRGPYPCNQTRLTLLRAEPLDSSRAQSVRGQLASTSSPVHPHCGRGLLD